MKIKKLSVKITISYCPELNIFTLRNYHNEKISREKPVTEDELREKMVLTGLKANSEKLLLLYGFAIQSAKLVPGEEIVIYKNSIDLK